MIDQVKKWKWHQYSDPTFDGVCVYLSETLGDGIRKYASYHAPVNWRKGETSQSVAQKIAECAGIVLEDEPGVPEMRC